MKARVYYAGKAFLCTEVVRWVSEEGLAVDVCTGGELAVALAAGADPARLGFHGNNKSVAELERAVRDRHRLDRDRQLDRARAARGDRRAAARRGTQPVLVRVNSGVHAETHDFLATAHEDQKFGFTPRGCRRPSSRASARLPALSLRRAALPHRLADLRHRRLRGVRRAARRAARRSCWPVATSRCSTSAAASASPTPRPTTPRPIEELAAGIVDAVAARMRRRAASRCPTSPSSPAAPSSGHAGVTLYEVGTTKPVERRSGRRAPVRQRRRRHERQRASGAVRRRVHARGSPRA